MMENPTTDMVLCLERLRGGEAAAREELLQTCQERLRLLTRRMLRQYPRVRRWEETDDVFQNALVRLDRALRDINVRAQMDSPEGFLRLAATMVRRELIDLARHYYGPAGHGANLVTPPPDPRSTPLADDPPAPSSADPARLVDWSEFHRQIEALPDEARRLFDLLWYQGLTLPEAADLLGIPTRTLRRHWQDAKLALIDRFGDGAPF